jgi:hypothetical protein
MLLQGIKKDVGQILSFVYLRDPAFIFKQQSQEKHLAKLRNQVCTNITNTYIQK